MSTLRSRVAGPGEIRPPPRCPQSVPSKRSLRTARTVKSGLVESIRNCCICRSLWSKALSNKKLRNRERRNSIPPALLQSCGPPPALHPHRPACRLLPFARPASPAAWSRHRPGCSRGDFPYSLPVGLLDGSVRPGALPGQGPLHPRGPSQSHQHEAPGGRCRVDRIPAQVENVQCHAGPFPSFAPGEAAGRVSEAAVQLEDERIPEHRPTP